MFSKLIKFVTAASTFALLAGSFIIPMVSADQPVQGGPRNLQGLPDVCGGKGCPVTGKALGNGVGSGQIVSLILQIAQIFTGILVALAVLFIVYGGFKYMNPNDADAAKNGTKILTNAAIGLVVAIVAATIVTVIKGIATGSYFG